jgi:hypothetical protein
LGEFENRYADGDFCIESIYSIMAEGEGVSISCAGYGFTRLFKLDGKEWMAFDVDGKEVALLKSDVITKNGKHREFLLNTH